ncbi:MAG TPA: hypothetical protein DEG88_05770 [Propionibacteriaceae bacterium]|nr:DUF2510 domain-containing protein [Micropruina sp.]HBX82297.1 hypothetical protein [Propionibacteriaceae bacterium]HBY22801.1 hypothetical protein [Propionibacteriaceae bacterium]
MPQPGWYPDPAGTPESLRFFDGTQWTTHVRSIAELTGTPNPIPGSATAPVAPLAPAAAPSAAPMGDGGMPPALPTPGQMGPAGYLPPGDNATWGGYLPGGTRSAGSCATPTQEAHFRAVARRRWRAGDPAARWRRVCGELAARTAPGLTLTDSEHAKVERGELGRSDEGSHVAQSRGDALSYWIRRPRPARLHRRVPHVHVDGHQDHRRVSHPDRPGEVDEWQPSRVDELRRIDTQAEHGRRLEVVRPARGCGEPRWRPQGIRYEGLGLRNDALLRWRSHPDAAHHFEARHACRPENLGHLRSGLYQRNGIQHGADRTG